MNGFEKGEMIVESFKPWEQCFVLMSREKGFWSEWENRESARSETKKMD